MKAIILTILIGIFFACNKNNAKPATTTSTTTAPTSTMSTYEYTFIGNWKMSNFALTEGTITVNMPANDSINCHLNITSTPFQGTDNYKKVFGGINCNNYNLFWKADNVGYFTYGGISYQVQKLTADSLIFSTGTISTQLQKYTFWK